MIMKRAVLKTLLISCSIIVAGYIFGIHHRAEVKYNDLMLNNIDALATGEDGEDDSILCVGTGSVYCRGYWVEIKMTGYSL